jgi:hypothetical protein
MKTTWFLLVFLILTFSSFTAHAQSRIIFIEGTAENREQVTFFQDNFKMEAEATGYTVAGDKKDAGYTFTFDVQPNIIEYDDGTRMQAPPDEDQYIIEITIFRNSDNEEIVTFSFSFTYLDEMYEYTQFLFIRGAANIPDEERGTVARREDDSWRNKWVYLKASFSMPSTIYALKPDGLTEPDPDDPKKKGMGTYYTNDKDEISMAAPLDNKFMLYPAMSLGLEVQLLNWLSIEPKIQAGWENMENTDYYTFSAGVDLKFPLKFIRNVMLSPYAAFSYPIYNIVPDPDTSWGDLYDSFPQYGVGGDLQFGIKAGRSGMLFIDNNYMYYMGDVARPNIDTVHPNPDLIHYQRSVIGLGIGYKYGIFNRK